MKKQTKVLLAAAMMTLGASFSAMAATKGTWVLNAEGWQYADKEGEYVSNEWCKSNGIDFWVNDDEVLGSSEWVQDGGYTYYVQSDGSKTVNAWKYLYAIEDDEEDEDQDWYYFDAKGRMVANTKKTIGGYDYYFDADGKMLTGWVDADGKEAAAKTDAIANIVFANDNGQVVKSSWLNEFPWTKNADDCYEGEDEEWFYAKKDGKLAVTKTNVDNLTYFFNKDTGIMIEGWVEKVDADTDYYTACNALTAGKTAYWTNEIGYAAKNTWMELEHPEEKDDVYWYHFNKLGEVFIASETDATLDKATFADGDSNSITPANDADIAEILKINGVEYYFNNKGEMLDGLQYVTVGTASNLMYFVDGAKQTGKVTLTDEYENDYTFVFAPKTEKGFTKYAAVTGNYDGYCYNNGQLMTAEEEGNFKLIETTAGKFIVDHNGKIQKKTTKEYFNEGETFTFVDADNNTKNSIVE